MWGMDDADVMTSPHCGLRICIRSFGRSVSCTERDAEDYGPASVRDQRDRLIHRAISFARC
jgi:hypothetical protein